LADRATPRRAPAIEISASKFVVNDRLAVAIAPWLRVIGAILSLANVENGFGFHSTTGNNKKRSGQSQRRWKFLHLISIKI